MAADTTHRYLSGFGNEHSSEALPGALPAGRNSPQRCPYGLYAEQFSGTAFTAPRAANRRSWLYRIRPAVTCGAFVPVGRDAFADAASRVPLAPNQLRWDPLPLPVDPTDFVDGLLPVVGVDGVPPTVFVIRRTSTRRLSARPAAVLLESTGLSLPRPIT